MLAPALLHKWNHKRGQMLSFTRARNGVVCHICNLPRGTNLADVAVFVVSPEFQMQCTQPLNIFNWCTLAVLPFFPKLDKRTKACRSLRSCASTNGGENIQFLYKYDKISLFGQICQHKAPCTPVQNGAGLGGRSSLHLKSTDKDRNTLASCNR